MPYHVEEPIKTYRIRNEAGYVVAQATEENAAYQLALWLEKGVVTLEDTESVYLKPQTAQTLVQWTQEAAQDLATWAEAQGIQAGESKVSIVTPTQQVEQPTTSSWTPGTRKLSDEQIEEIRRLYRDSAATHADLAERYGVSKATISNYTRGAFSDAATNGAYATVK